MSSQEEEATAHKEVGWVAIAYGVVDVSGATQFAEDAELIVVPAVPGDPLAIAHKGARLWRRLVQGAVNDSELDEDERVIVREMVEAGVASARLDHPARMREVPAPWLSSPLHELVYALVQSVARDVGVRITFLKGPALHAQGLREREHSGDVDLWADPERIDTLVSALEKWGWAVQPDIWSSAQINHSVTLVPTIWGCEIDVHRRMPGLGIADRDAFRVIVEHSEPLRFGGVRCEVPQGDYHAVLAALHFMRPEVGVGVRHGAVERASAVLDRIGEGVVPAVGRLDAWIALREALELALPGQHLDSANARPPHDWYWRGQDSKSRAYRMAMRGLPLLLRIKLTYRLLWPEGAVIRASDERQGLRRTGAVRARMRRLKRGLFGRR